MHAFRAHRKHCLQRVEDREARPDGGDPSPAVNGTIPRSSRRRGHIQNASLRTSGVRRNAVNRRHGAADGLAVLRAILDTLLMQPLSNFLAATAVLLTASLLLSVKPHEESARKSDPQFTSDGQMKMPEDYRRWVYLTTGFDMSYSANAGEPDHHMFDNVFVNPEAYEVFVKTGTWPDKTTFVLEVRGARNKGSINKRGNFQDDVMGLEVHVKDSGRFKGQWAFFGFDGVKTAKMIPETASCYTCHTAHGAVDNTFVQFYPTLLPLAKAKGTLSENYRKDPE